MAESLQIERARECYRRRSWREARAHLSALDREGLLQAEDLERLARAADLLGRTDEFLEVMERAHRGHLDAGDPPRAARAAFWLGMHLAEQGQMARAGGWFGRAGRLVETRECVERGYLLLASGYRAFAQGDPTAAATTAERAVEVAQRFHDDDLLALALHLQGRALVRDARVSEGLALLDEAMVAVASDGLAPHVTGLIYCSVISACRDVCALRRAWEWTDALSDWCARHEDLVAYTDQCRVNRAEIMVLRGEWRGAIEEARRAMAHDGEPGRSVTAASLYQQGEAHRLLGELGAAEEAFREASKLGREPLPGLALLRLAQDDAAAAAAALRRALAAANDAVRRVRLLPAHIEVMVAVADHPEAWKSAQELDATARRLGTDFLGAAAAHALGSVHLARGEAAKACAALRDAHDRWQTLQAPYHAARAREALALACRALGDGDSADLELEAAKAAYRRLEAAADLSRLEPARPTGSHGLTSREREVLAELATGKSNRAIGDELFISERTVARHVSNIFAKLGLSSRAAATAYAYEHDLLEPPA